MRCKTACLIINPRAGKKIDELGAMISVLSAAGWKLDTAVKEFGGHSRKLARRAAQAGYDLVLGFGGDGTLNQVVNGVMTAKWSGCIVGVIPGGTANVWAHEIGMPEDPIKACLLLIDSDERKVDVGHVAVESPAFAPGKKGDQKESDAPRGRHHFLLMAGLGVDAAIMRQVPTSLKERIGRAAVVIAAARTLPSQRAFPLEVWSDVEGEESIRWSGEALQVIVGNTRRYGNFAEVTPDALVDDGALDVCIITGGNPITTIQQLLSILLHRNPRNGRSEHFRSSRFYVRAPASIDLQLDGSRVKVDVASGQTSPRQRRASEPVMVTYRFDAMSRALRVAIPRTYDGPLFERGSTKESERGAEGRAADHELSRVGAFGAAASTRVQSQDLRRHAELLEHGRKVTVVGVVKNPERRTTYIVAGRIFEKETAAAKPVAVRINHKTTLVGLTGEFLPITAAASLRENAVIVVEGKQSKRGVVRAKRVVMLA